MWREVLALAAVTVTMLPSPTQAATSKPVTPTEVIYTDKDGKPLEAETEAEPETEATTEEATESANAYGVSMTSDERALLERIVAAEGQNDSFESRVAIVETILNRVQSKKFNDTVYGVLSEKGQFATWRMRNASWVEPKYGVSPVAYVLEHGRTVLPSGDYLYFSTSKMGYAKDYIKIGKTYFGRAK